MNMFVLVLAVIEAIIALGGLVFAVWCVAQAMHFIGLVIGLVIAVVFGMMAYGTFGTARQKEE